MFSFYLYQVNRAKGKDIPEALNILKSGPSTRSIFFVSYRILGRIVLVEGASELWLLHSIRRCGIVSGPFVSFAVIVFIPTFFRIVTIA